MFSSGASCSLCPEYRYDDKIAAKTVRDLSLTSTNASTGEKEKEKETSQFAEVIA